MDPGINSDRQFLELSGFSGWRSTHDNFVSKPLTKEEAHIALGKFLFELQLPENDVAARELINGMWEVLIVRDLTSAKEHYRSITSVAQKNLFPSQSKEKEEYFEGSTGKVNPVVDITLEKAKDILRGKPIGEHYLFELEKRLPGGIVIAMQGEGGEVKMWSCPKLADKYMGYNIGKGACTLEDLKNFAKEEAIRASTPPIEKEEGISSMSADQADKELINEPLGTYILRPSKSQNDGSVTLSVKTRNGVDHTLFKKISDNPLRFQDTSGNTYNSLSDIKAIAEKLKKHLAQPEKQEERVIIRNMSTDQANRELINQAPGTFILRYSQSQPGALALSMKKLNNDVQHTLFYKVSDNPLQFQDTSGGIYNSPSEINALAEKIKKQEEAGAQAQKDAERLKKIQRWT